jgi:hypothetical protein
MQYAPTSPQWRGDSTPKIFKRSVAARGGDGVQPSIAQHPWKGRTATRPDPGPSGDVWPTNNNREQRSRRRDQVIAVESTNHLDR